MSEIIGEKGLPIDRFARMIGYHREGAEAKKIMSKEDLETAQAYCDGVNEYIRRVKLTGSNASARLWPPEFYALGITDMDEWTVEDVLSIAKVMTFNLTWNWNQELARDIFSELDDEIKDMIEELAPFTAEYSHNLVTIIDEEDLPEHEKSDVTIQQRYNEYKAMLAAGISPVKAPETPAVEEEEK